MVKVTSFVQFLTLTALFLNVRGKKTTYNACLKMDKTFFFKEPLDDQSVGYIRGRRHILKLDSFCLICLHFQPVQCDTFHNIFALLGKKLNSIISYVFHPDSTAVSTWLKVADFTFLKYICSSVYDQRVKSNEGFTSSDEPTENLF